MHLPKATVFYFKTIPKKQVQTASNLWIDLKLQKERFINLWLTSLFEGIEFLISDSIT